MTKLDSRYRLRARAFRFSVQSHDLHNVDSGTEPQTLERLSTDLYKPSIKDNCGWFKGWQVASPSLNMMDTP